MAGGGGVMNWEIGIDIYTLICVKWIINKNLPHKKTNPPMITSAQNYTKKQNKKTKQKKDRQNPRTNGKRDRKSVV